VQELPGSSASREVNTGRVLRRSAGIIGAGVNFSYTDKDFKSGDNFYRIYEIDSRGRRIQICNTVHVNAIIKQPLISLLGNPVSKEISIRINAVNDQTLSLVMFDMQGRSIVSKELSVKQGVNNFKIDVNNISTGIYMLKIPGTGYVEKLFITRH